jgi:hypothetical protein
MHGIRRYLKKIVGGKDFSNGLKKHLKKNRLIVGVVKNEKNRNSGNSKKKFSNGL